jgi:Transglutaminase-like superfamily
MSTYRIVVQSIIISLLLTITGGAADPPLLTAPPIGDQWFTISMGDERTGFTRTTICAAPEGYEVASDSSARMVVLGFSRNAWSRESYLVNRDLSIKSFHVDESIDGKPMTLSGVVTSQGVRISVTEEGKRREKTLKLQGKIYPGPLLNIYPLMLGGLVKDRIYRPRTLDIEEAKVKEVTISVVGREKHAGEGDIIHLRNNVYPLVDNDIWVDTSGNTIRESVREGLIITAAETAATARKELFAAALAKKEWLADFSAIRTDGPINHPEALKKLVVELSGIPADMPLISAAGQKAERQDGGRVLFSLSKVQLPHENGRNGSIGPETVKKTETSAAAHHGHEAIAAREKPLPEEEKNHAAKVEQFAYLIAASKANCGSDTPHPDASRLINGDTLSRVRRYAALAEAAGVPTRIVAGIAHSVGKEFFYHVWAESFVGEWLPVDPCAGQAPADAAHIRLTDLFSPKEAADLAGLIGHLRAKIIEEHY